MHPILSQLRRIIIYLLAWVPIAGLLAYLLTVSHEISDHEAIVLSVPLCLLYAFLCLSAWYSCRGNRSQHHLGCRGRKPRQHAFKNAIFSGIEPPLPPGSSAGNRHRPAALSAVGNSVLRIHLLGSFARRRSPRDESQRPGARRRTARAESPSKSALPVQQPEFHQRFDEFRRVQGP